MSSWTTGEIKKLKSLHHSGISRAEMIALFPRHSAAAVSSQASLRGIRRCAPVERHKKETSAQKWERIAREHFARRQAGHLA